MMRRVHSSLDSYFFFPPFTTFFFGADLGLAPDGAFAFFTFFAIVFFSAFLDTFVFTVFLTPSGLALVAALALAAAFADGMLSCGGGGGGWLGGWLWMDC